MSTKRLVRTAKPRPKVVVRSAAKKQKPYSTVRRDVSSGRRQVSSRVVRGMGDYKVSGKRRTKRSGPSQATLNRLIAALEAKQEAEKVPAKDERGVGAQIGEFLGAGAEKVLRTVFGFGDYAPIDLPQIHKNSLLDMGTDPPQVKNTMMQNNIVRHREYLGDVVTSGDGRFKIAKYPLNPGQLDTFPWMVNIANNYEQWKPRGIIFEFKSMVGNVTSDTVAGLPTVIMATEYDATRPSFTNKMQMENHEYAQSAKASVSFLHPVECEPSQNVLSELYVRTESAADPTELRTSDFGNFYIATVGGQVDGEVALGELWVTYEFEMLKPRLAAPEGSLIQSTHFSATGAGITSITATHPLGNPPLGTFKTGSTFKVALTDTNITFPEDITQGVYIVVYQMTGASTAGVKAPTYSVGSGLDILTFWQNSAAPEVLVPSNSVAAQVDCCCSIVIVNINAPLAELLLQTSGAPLCGTPTGMDLFITSVSSAFIPITVPDEVRHLACKRARFKHLLPTETKVEEQEGEEDERKEEQPQDDESDESDGEEYEYKLLQRMMAQLDEKRQKKAIMQKS